MKSYVYELDLGEELGELLERHAALDGFDDPREYAVFWLGRYLEQAEDWLLGNLTKTQPEDEDGDATKLASRLHYDDGIPF